VDILTVDLSETNHRARESNPAKRGAVKASERKLKKFALAGFIAAAFTLSLFLIFSRSPQTTGAPGFETHDPISINGDAQFTSANGVRSGTGTPSDPYIIENWVISASSAHGIYITNTTAYFIVRNCLVENGGGTYYGIYLDNVINGRIENNTCENNKYGIAIVASNYNSLTNNTCENSPWYGIRLSSSNYDNLTNNTCSNNHYGIELSSSKYNNLTNNTCSNNTYGIYLYMPASSHNNLINNTTNSNTYGIYLAFYASSNIFTGNVISNNGTDIYNTGTTNTYSSNQFNNNAINKMLTLTENTRTENVGDNVSFSASAFNLNGTNLSDGTTVTISPSESSLSYSDNGSGTITGWFIPTKSGVYSLNFTVTDENANTTRRRALFFVGDTASTTTKYYFRGTRPTHGQPYGTGLDSKTLLLTAPTSTEIWNCGNWVQNSPDEMPNYPLANLSAIDTYTWYKQSKVSGAYIGAQRYITYNQTVDENNPVENVSDYTWINENFAGLNWAMDYPRSWYWLSLKLYGSNPYWTTFPSGHSDQPSYADFTYTFTTTPIIKSISNPDDIVLLSATASVSDSENATIVLEGSGSTDIVLENYRRPFIGCTTIISSDNTTTLALDDLTGTTTINSAALDIIPSSGSISVNIHTWNTSGNCYRKWVENASSPGITATHTVGDLKSSKYYIVKVDGVTLDTYKSNSSGQITFTYNLGYSTKTFEVFEHSRPKQPETLMVDMDPLRLKTFTPTLSFLYASEDNYNCNMVHIQVGTSEGDNSMWDDQQAVNAENGAKISITYAGTPLRRGVQYYWRARARDNENIWSDWSENESFKLSPSPVVAMGDGSAELRLLEAGDEVTIQTSSLAIKLSSGARTEALVIYYSHVDEAPSIPAESVAPFYFIITSTDPSAISSVTITLNVPRSWVQANDIIPSTLTAWRKDDEAWQPLPSRLVSADALYYYLEVTTSGFSLFGVSGQKRATIVQPPAPTPAPQAPTSDQQLQQAIFIATLGMLVTSVMLIASSFMRHKRRR
jgi:parallel beta-helix repeat protein